MSAGATAPPREASRPRGARVLVTGMSGVGKSTVLARLAARGLATLDTDDGGWTVPTAVPGQDEPEPLWDELRLAALLDAHDDDRHLVVAGTVANQGRLYPRFDAVVLLSAPLDVTLARIASRTTNDFGKAAHERARVVADHAVVEPLLRRGATHEVDARRPLAEVAAAVLAIADDAAARAGDAPGPGRGR